MIVSIRLVLFLSLIDDLRGMMGFGSGHVSSKSGLKQSGGHGFGRLALEMALHLWQLLSTLGSAMGIDG